MEKENRISFRWNRKWEQYYISERIICDSLAILRRGRGGGGLRGQYIWAGSLEKATMKKFGGKTVEAAKEDDLVMSMGRLSMRSSPAVRVPPLSAYAIGKPAVAVAGKEVVVGEMIPKAEAIPDNFPSTYAYLKVC